MLTYTDIVNLKHQLLHCDHSYRLPSHHDWKWIEKEFNNAFPAFASKLDALNNNYAKGLKDLAGELGDPELFTHEWPADRITKSMSAMEMLQGLSKKRAEEA